MPVGSLQKQEGRDAEGRFKRARREIPSAGDRRFECALQRPCQLVAKGIRGDTAGC